MDVDAAAVRVDDLLHDVKAEPQTFVAAGPLAAAERIEEMRQDVRRDDAVVTLTNSALTPLITGVTYDFGDQTALETGGTTMTHVYTRPGDFRVTETVRLNDGRSTVGSLNVIVQP